MVICKNAGISAVIMDEWSETRPDILSRLANVAFFQFLSTAAAHNLWAGEFSHLQIQARKNTSSLL